MKRFFLICLCFLTSVGLWAKVAPGENILSNGEFETDRSDTPPKYWSVTGTQEFFEFCLSGGPENKGFVRLINKGEAYPKEITLRQSALILVPGERYKFSGWVRTIDFTGGNNGIIVFNYGWRQTAGFSPLPENQDWTYMEMEFTAFSSANGEFTMGAYAKNFTGELDFADFKLEALSDGALAGSSPMESRVLAGMQVLVPWEPLLQKIPADKPVVSFKMFGKVENLESLDLCVSTSDTGKMVSMPLALGVNYIRLPDGSRVGDLTVSIRNRESGEETYSNTYPYAVKDIPKVSGGEHKRLNNLCTEILNKPIEATAAAQKFDFVTTRDGWIFIAAENAASPELEIVLDGELTVITNETLRLESFREVALGSHTLEIKGAVNGGNLVVRSIAETLNYCPGANSHVAENPPYDWDFQVKYGLPGITTQNGGNIPKEKREWFKAQGYHWIANLMSTNLKDDNDLTSRLEKSAGMNQDDFTGVTCDEQFFSQPAMLRKFTHGLHNYANPKNHVVYSWIVGEPSTPGIDEEFFSENMNSCGGRGKLLIEAYCHTRETEAEARKYLDDKIVKVADRFRELFPSIFPSLAFILGDFNQVPIVTLHHHPEVDMKYFLDMQLNILANAPELAGIGCVGYWGSYYADHEFHRWAYMLLRHYVVEGNTTMLSDKYGFKYIPGHMVNGDFNGTFDGWTTQGNLSLDRVYNLANSSQNRWGGNAEAGDTFAVFTKVGDETSTLKQTAKGLIPGRAYLLQFCTFDVDYVKAKNTAWRDFGIRATLGDGATIREDLSWQHIDKRGEKGRYAQNYGVARPNVHHIVFIANAPQVEIMLDNSLSKPGEHLGVNFLSLSPFLLEE